MVSASAKDRAASKELETQRCWLFVSLERWMNGALELAQEIETEEHSQQGRLGSEKRPQAEVIGRQFVLEFVNAALYGGSAIVIAPDFQSCIGAISDEDPKHITRQVDELATYGRLFRLD
jgi:hypothetical protein